MRRAAAELKTRQLDGYKKSMAPPPVLSFDLLRTGKQLGGIQRSREWEHEGGEGEHNRYGVNPLPGTANPMHGGPMQSRMSRSTSTFGAKKPASMNFSRDS